MNHFFNNSNANIIQCISLPLEILGFILTSIEILRPKFADEIEIYIDLLGKRLLQIFNKEYTLEEEVKVVDKFSAKIRKIAAISGIIIMIPLSYIYYFKLLKIFSPYLVNFMNSLAEIDEA